VWSVERSAQPSSCLSNTNVVKETARIQRHLLEDVIGRSSNLFQFFGSLLNPSKISFRMAKMSYEADK